jgi:hypothetical protein
MPKYRVELSDGRKFEIEADGPPSEQDVLSALNTDAAPAKAAAPAAAPAGNRIARMALNVGRYLSPLGSIEAIAKNPKGSLATLGAAAATGATGGAALLPMLAAAGLGGAGGAATGSMVEAAQGKDPGSVPATMLKHGAAQAAMQGVGAGVAAGAGRVARGVMRGTLRPSKRIQEEFGDVVGTTLKERLPVGASERAAAKMAGSAQQAKQMIGEAQAAGAAPVRAKELHPEMQKVAEKLQKRVELGKVDERPELLARAQEIYKQNPQGIPLSRAQELKSEAQEAASQVFRALEKGNVVKDSGALADKAVATGLRKAIEQRVPAVGPVNARTQALMGAKEALEDAEARNVGIVGIGNILGSFMPRAASTGAITLNELARLPMPNMFRAALLGLMNSGQPEQ